MNGLGLNYYNSPGTLYGNSFGDPRLLGARQCPRGFTWNGSGNYCEKTSGGGSNKFIMPAYLNGISVVQQDVIDQANYDALPITDKVIQWASDNPVLAIGAAAALGYILYKFLK